MTEIDVSNAEAYVKEYAPLAQASIKKAGGKLLVASLNVTAVEGTPPKRVAIQVWDSIEQVEAWRNSADYKEARKIGDKYATFRAFAVPAAPQALVHCNGALRPPSLAASPFSVGMPGSTRQSMLRKMP